MSLAAMKVRRKHDAPNSRSAYVLYAFERHRQGGFPHGWGPQGRVSAITSKKLESSERGTKGRPPGGVPGNFGPRDKGTWRNIATSPWISPSWIWNWWHLFRGSSLLLRQIQTWVRARVQLYTLAAQDLWILAHLAIKVCSEDQVSKEDSIQAFDRETTVRLRFHQAKLTQRWGLLCSLWALDLMRLPGILWPLIFLQTHCCFADLEDAGLGTLANRLSAGWWWPSIECGSPRLIWLFM